jgi:hypothetical protein
MKNLTMLIILLCSMFLLAGCSGGDDAATTAEETAPATEAAPTTEAAPAEADAVAAVHDCDGGCGMKAQPEESMTEVGGKWFCAGCVDKAKETSGHG